jgi:hypothetical protein
MRYDACSTNVTDASAAVIFRVEDKSLKVEALCYIKTVVPVYQITRYHTPEDYSLYS